MLSISHVATGAFIASKVTNPILAIPLILASHYIEDWIPHWDVGTGLSTGKRKRKDAIRMELVELAISFGIVYLFWHAGSAQFPWFIYLGGFVGLIPDFLEAPRNFWKWEPAWLKPLNNFHGMFHHSTPNKVIGLLPQVVLLICIYLLK